MNTKQTKVYFLLIMLLVTFCGMAQEKIVHGVVTTFDSIPLINVEIKVLSTKEIIKTDTLGRFSVASNEKDKIKITAEGFYSKKVNVIKQTKMVVVNLKLKEGEKAREFALGYTNINDRDKLNAVAGLNSEEMEFSQFTTMYDLIRGKFASVQVINGEVIIRGIKPSGNSAALIVVDGVSRNGAVLSALSPAQVKSITIIKDGSSSIYGMNGANGVVVINTKK